MINLKVDHVSKKLDKFQLKDISFQIEAGTVMGFVGENGAGKTTTIQCILQLLKPDSGCIELFGEAFHFDAIHLKEQLGVVLNDIQLPPSYDVKDVEALYTAFYSNWNSEYFNKLLLRLNVPKYTRIDKMSTGTQKKLAIAACLSYAPKLLILDEPTSSLDPTIRDEILNILAEHMENEECSILISSHITSDLEKIADTVTFIHDGSIIFSENKDELLSTFKLFKGTLRDSIDIPKSAIYGKRESAFGVEVLVKANEVSKAIPLQPATLEELIILRTKELKRQALPKLEEVIHNE